LLSQILERQLAAYRDFSQLDGNLVIGEDGFFIVDLE